ncbi:MAG: 3-phosphoshikimate 1-carboxyvinyltransferase [Planctomycetota bacterium]|jgi:3-phosphoshikimate 1-carboxyvinyltransferase
MAAASADEIEIAPAGRIRATVRVPGSKSHTNRSLVIAALSGGESRLEGALFAADTSAMIGALHALGFRVEPDEAAKLIVVEGRRGIVPARGATVDARDAGTVMRFLTAVAALGEGEFTIDGSARMRERPVGDLVEGLRSLGVDARATGPDGRPPVVVRANGLAGGAARVSAATSSQFASALLLAAPCAKSPVTIELEGEVVSRPFIELTLDLMKEFGAEAERPSPDVFRVAAPRPYRAGAHHVEGDATAASYFWAAAAVTGGRVEVANVGTRSHQGDARFVDVLEEMGCRVERSERRVAVSGPEALRGGEFDLNAMPDVAQTLAVVALFADSPVVISNVANLRVKECDRLSALAAELPKLGGRVEERPDGIAVTPPEGGRKGLRGGRIATYNDHRMAMSFAVAGLAIPGVVIGNPGCVSKTYPAFFDDLARLAGE